MIAVILATRNGAARLPETLTSIAGQADPGVPWRVFVVDSASSDATPQVLASFADRLPMTRLTAPDPGQNRARNLALDALAADDRNGLVCFTDDDVVADPRWLAELAAGAARHPGFDLFGGRVLPDWPAPPPEWLLAAVPDTVTFAATDAAFAEEPIEPWFVYSPSMAVRPALFLAGHRFDPTMGPTGAADYAMGSESEFLFRMAALGHRALHLPRAVVRHRIRPQQLAPAALRARARRFGRGQYRMGRLAAIAPPGRGEPVRLVARVALAALGRVAALADGPGGRLRRDWELHFAIGSALESRVRRRVKPPAPLRRPL